MSDWNDWFKWGMAVIGLPALLLFLLRDGWVLLILGVGFGCFLIIAPYVARKLRPDLFGEKK